MKGIQPCLFRYNPQRKGYCEVSKSNRKSVPDSIVFGGIGLVLLIIGIVMLVTNKKDKKWVDDINARNASQGIGGQPAGQPLSGYGQQSGGAPNPYQNNNQNM